MELLYFSASWCAPCRRFGPIVDKVTHDMQIKLTKYDVDNDMHKAWQYKVMSVPTLILLEGETTRKRAPTAMSEDDLRLWLS
jgi:thioredoxin 1